MLDYLNRMILALGPEWWNHAMKIPTFRQHIFDRMKQISDDCWTSYAYRPV